MSLPLDWLSVVLVFLLLLDVCCSDGSAPQGEEGLAPKSDILQKVEGTVQVVGAPSDDWLVTTRVCLDGGEHCGFLRASGDFVIHNVPAGSYLVEVYSPNYVFEPVRVDISSKNGKIRAREVNVLKSTAVNHRKYPLLFKTEKQAGFFEKRESWSLISTLKNPMVGLQEKYSLDITGINLLIFLPVLLVDI